MRFHSPSHSSSPCIDDALCTARGLSPTRENRDSLHLFPCSPSREYPFDPVHADRMRCKQELHKLYENTLEGVYDLSLKDIVDPRYSISGNHKAAMVTDADAQDVGGRGRNRKGSSIPKLTFSFSFPGLRRSRSKCKRPNLCEGHAKDREGSASQHYSDTNRSPARRSNSEAGATSMSRIHPSNQCSMCSSYTIYFKCRCLVCGRLYCSNCTREHMDNLPDGGFKCKESCKSRFLNKRLSQKFGSTCWPFGKGFDAQRLQSYT